MVVGSKLLHYLLFLFFRSRSDATAQNNFIDPVLVG